MTKNSLISQRKRLLQALQKHPVTTIEARRNLGILGVAPRVHELRHQGFNIKTYWANYFDPIIGSTHKIAKYVLLSGFYKSNCRGKNDK